MTTIRKAFVAAALLLSSQFLTLNSVEAQVSLDWHGFVNPHYYADSRSVVGGREDMMLFYPKPIVRDSLGNDLNNDWQANMLAITARLGLKINGPEMLGANTSAYIEGDFTGSTNATINNLRLRHAYIKTEWGSGSEAAFTTIVGQYWYPMVIHEIMPMTNPLNMGAPFHCYARQPQVRYDLMFPESVHNIFTASWQLDNASQGLLDGVPTTSTQFARHTLIPELNYRFSIGEKSLLGVAFNWKTIQPIVPDPQDSRHTTFSWTIFGKWTYCVEDSTREEKPRYVLKGQALLNNSLYEGCSLGGYLMLADSTFEDWHFNTVWLDNEYIFSSNCRVGLFLGIAKNLDYGKHTDALHIFGRGHDIEYLWRIQPRFSWTTWYGVTYTCEAEYTYAGYAEPVGNLRLSLSMTYAF